MEKYFTINEEKRSIPQKKRQRTDQPEFLCNRREDEIRMHLWDQPWMAMCKPRPPHATRTKGEEGLDNLIAHTVGICPWMKPDIKANAHMTKEGIAQSGGNSEDQHGNQDIRATSRRHIGHKNGDAEKQQCRTKILCDDEQQDCHSPDTEEWRDKTQRWQLKQEKTMLNSSQYFLMVRKIR